MKDCKECRFGRWALFGVHNDQLLEIRSCTECGKSQAQCIQPEYSPKDIEKDLLAEIEKKISD